MENKEIRENEGTKKNAKNLIIVVVMGEVKVGMLTKNMANQMLAIIAKNLFLCKKINKNAMLHGQNQLMGEKNEKLNNPHTIQTNGNNTSILKGSYRQIMVNPTQLSEHEFTNWMEKLMEARKNRQERKREPLPKLQKTIQHNGARYKTSSIEE